MSARLSLPLAFLFAVSSACGIFWPAVYARETALWAAQGTGQDWVDLILVAPALALGAVFTLRGSRLAVITLAGLLAYTVYSQMIYAFGLHFNPLFLLYCAQLSLAGFALVSISLELSATDMRSWFVMPTPNRLAGGWLVLCGLLFASVWLSEIIPATLANEVPKSLREIGLTANPVHILDLAFALPAMILGGVALMRNQPLGYRMVPPLLVFTVVMCMAIGGMMAVMAARGVSEDGSMAGVFAGVAVVGGTMVVVFLRHLRRS